MDCALPSAYKSLQASWNQARTLPESFPAYLLQVESSQPAAWRQEIEDTMGLATTGLFDTHPSNGDRIRRARRAGEPGVFHLDGPATGLFADFEVLAKQITVLHYAEDLGIPMATVKLVPLSGNPALVQIRSTTESND
ncbi:MAG: hypothetical protein KGS61_18425 [Verrucomicrobia bacterium]|nr:hypothetical protein [Verrucomicrobiota bacterium]